MSSGNRFPVSFSFISLIGGKTSFSRGMKTDVSADDRGDEKIIKESPSAFIGFRFSCAVDIVESF